MLIYSAFGMVIASEIALPELMHEPNAAIPDVRIRFGAAYRDLAGGRSFGDYISGSPDELWFRVPEVGKFLISKGSEIWIEPEEGAAEDAVRLFLLGSAFGALLLQRGLMVLHGNAIRIGDRCMVCVGESGAGKSTLAAGFMQRGFPVLADDVVPLDGEFRAIPGFPRLKLWQDAAAHLAISTDGLRRIQGETAKFNIPLGDAFGEAPVPVRWIYVLHRAPASEFRIDELHGAGKFGPLQANAYRPEFLVAMNLLPDHLQGCGALASRARICRVTRPEEGFSLTALIDTLLADISANP